jgi:hypothetical protein
MHVWAVEPLLLMRPDQLPECPPETRVSVTEVPDGAHPLVLLSNPGFPIRFWIWIAWLFVPSTLPAVSHDLNETVADIVWVKGAVYEGLFSVGVEPSVV